MADVDLTKVTHQVVRTVSADVLEASADTHRVIADELLAALIIGKKSGKKLAGVQIKLLLIETE